MKKNKKVGFILMGIVTAVLFGFSIFLPTRVNKQYAGAIDVTDTYTYHSISFTNTMGYVGITNNASDVDVNATGDVITSQFFMFDLYTTGAGVTHIDFTDVINFYNDTNNSYSSASTSLESFGSTARSRLNSFAGTSPIASAIVGGGLLGDDSCLYILRSDTYNGSLVFFSEVDSDFNSNVIKLNVSSYKGQDFEDFFSNNYNLTVTSDVLTIPRQYYQTPYDININVTGGMQLHEYKFSDANDKTCSLYFFALNDVQSYELGITAANYSDYNSGYQAGYSEGYNIGSHSGTTYDNGYNNGYDAGYDAGLSDGDTAGYNRGYRWGYGLGYDNGETVGRAAGIASANDYTFLGLIGAVIDAPIQAFTGLLDFNVLGVNMRNFLISLFSISIVFVIIKFALGRVGK